MEGLTVDPLLPSVAGFQKQTACLDLEASPPTATVGQGGQSSTLAENVWLYVSERKWAVLPESRWNSDLLEAVSLQGW